MNLLWRAAKRIKKRNTRKEKQAALQMQHLNSPSRKEAGRRALKSVDKMMGLKIHSSVTGRIVENYGMGLEFR